MDELSVRTYECEGRRVIEPSGEITVLNIRPFREAVAGLEGQDCEAVVDLRKVPYIDSAGIEQLVVAYRILRRRDRKLVVVVQPGSQPDHVLEAVALHTFAVFSKNAEEYGLERNDHGERTV